MLMGLENFMRILSAEYNFEVMGWLVVVPLGCGIVSSRDFGSYFNFQMPSPLVFATYIPPSQIPEHKALLRIAMAQWLFFLIEFGTSVGLIGWSSWHPYSQRALS